MSILVSVTAEQHAGWVSAHFQGEMEPLLKYAGETAYVHVPLSEAPEDVDGEIVPRTVDWNIAQVAPAEEKWVLLQAAKGSIEFEDLAAAHERIMELPRAGQPQPSQQEVVHDAGQAEEAELPEENVVVTTEVPVYETMKVDDLKDLLRERQLQVSGTKDDLVARLQENDAAQAAAETAGEENAVVQEERQGGEEGEQQAPAEEPAEEAATTEGGESEESTEEQSS